MTTVEHALASVLSHCGRTEPETVSLDRALGRFLAEDLHAPFPLPSFRQSAMDGYALRWDPGNSRYELVAELAAGSAENPAILEGQCVRIFTGAAVPDDADTVIMQEWARKEGAFLHITRPEGVRTGQHIRPVGEQIEKGACCMRKGTRLSAAGISYLRSFGFSEVPVSRQAAIGLLLTGDELVAPGERLRRGQIYESNSYALSNALISNDFALTSMRKVPDDPHATIQAISDLLDQSDVVLISGGISVGDRDHVHAALEALGVEQVFYKVAQKPGKPFYFGRKGARSIFALPGNPASALTCLYAYVLPHLRQLSGAERPLGIRLMLPIAADYQVKGDRALFLKARILDGQVHILDAQASSMLHSFAIADGLIYLPAGTGRLAAGDHVQIHLIR